jgi:hypothetical protein
MYVDYALADRKINEVNINVMCGTEKRVLRNVQIPSPAPINRHEFTGKFVSPSGWDHYRGFYARLYLPLPWRH